MTQSHLPVVSSGVSVITQRDRVTDRQPVTQCGRTWGCCIKACHVFVLHKVKAAPASSSPSGFDQTAVEAAEVTQKLQEKGPGSGLSGLQKLGFTEYPIGLTACS